MIDGEGALSAHPAVVHRDGGCSRSLDREKPGAAHHRRSKPMPSAPRFLMELGAHSCRSGLAHHPASACLGGCFDEHSQGGRDGLLGPRLQVKCHRGGPPICNLALSCQTKSACHAHPFPLMPQLRAFSGAAPGAAGRLEKTLQVKPSGTSATQSCLHCHVKTGRPETRTRRWMFAAIRFADVFLVFFLEN